MTLLDRRATGPETAARSRDAPNEAWPLHTLLLVVGLAAAVTGQGAYFATGQRVLGAVLVVAFVLALRVSPLTRSDLRSSLLVACGALAAWSVVSAVAAGDPAGAFPVVALLAAVAGVLVVCRRSTPTQRDGLVTGIVAVGVLCALSGWVGIAWRVVPWAWEDQGLYRAATTLTYANATAGLLAPVALVTLGRLASRPASLASGLAACVLLLGVGSTLSRGGVLALVVGGVVLALLLGLRPLLRTASAPAAGALVAFAALVPSMPGASPPRPLLAVAGLALGLAITAAVPTLRGPNAGPGLRGPNAGPGLRGPNAGPGLRGPNAGPGLRGPNAVTSRSRGGVAVAVAALLGVAVVAVAFGGAIWQGVGQVTGPRLTVDSPDRSKETAAAARLVAEHPLTGTGPGRAVLLWTEPDGERYFARWAHNEYLQVAAELGLPGLVLLGAVLVTAAGTVARGRRWAPSSGIWAGVAAGLVALAVHSALDFLWHLSAIPLLAAVLVGTITRPTQQEAT